jgi:hypothetical protein
LEPQTRGVVYIDYFGEKGMLEQPKIGSELTRGWRNSMRDNFASSKSVMQVVLPSLRLALVVIFGLIIAPQRSFAHDLGTMTTIGKLLNPNSCPSVTPARPFVPPTQGYVRKYNTIAHHFLDAEVGAGDVTPAMYAILDVLLDESIAALKPYPSNLSIEQAKKFAVDSLVTIDCILLRHGFVYPGHGLVALLSDGLGPTMYERVDDLNELRNQTHNIRRRKFIDARGTEPFYVVDCDVASYIYLAVAEVMKYPLHLVEIPRHNFVRWQLDSATFINFETMDGAETDNAYYKENWGIAEAFVGRGGILDTMNDKQTIAYHDATVAISWSWRGNLDRMIEVYLRSISIDSTHALALNNLAWFYAAVPKGDRRDGAKAVQYGLQTVAVIPDGDSLDTLACAYAQSGNFARAIEVEMDAIKVSYAPFGSNLTGDLALFRSNGTCNDVNFGKDPMPFRPGQSVARAATDKDLLRLH